ncbi:PQQ-dependent sugar dehydrogenase [Tessaracoccus sp.]
MRTTFWEAGAAVVAVATALTGCVAAPSPVDPQLVTPPPLSANHTPDAQPSVVSTLGSAAPSPYIGEAELLESPVEVATGLESPWSVVFHTGVAIVSERDSGRILEVAEDGSPREMAVIEEVVADGEGGLLGLTVDDQGRLYAYYSAAEDNRIVRFDINGGAGSLSLGTPEVILDGVRKSSTHNGGRIAFGPDGMLYATAGDAGEGENAQNLGSLSGKILRMTADGDVPPDNPFAGSLVWSFGHRNPQGLAWSDDGTMFATEFGQNTWDELNIIEPGKNYGWPLVEGVAKNRDFVDPVQQWAPKDASPSGMVHLNGFLYIANLRGESLRAVPLQDVSTSTVFWEGTYGRLRDVVVTPRGYLWVLTNNTDGRGRPVSPVDDRLLAISPETLVD